MKHITTLLIACAVLFICDIAEAQRDTRNPSNVIPAEQFQDARIWLARACIAEEGWGDLAGCDAVSFVYMRRWEAAQHRRRGPISFTMIIRGHAAALRPNRTELSPRQQMVLGLPETAPNDRALAVWNTTLAHVDQWYEGRFNDPCLGSPRDFGGAGDGVPYWWVRAQCDGGHNRFWIPQRRPAPTPLRPVTMDARGTPVVYVGDMHQH